MSRKCNVAIFFAKGGSCRRWIEIGSNFRSGFAEFQVSPNEKVTVGFIATGRMGQSNLLFSEKGFAATGTKEIAGATGRC